MVKLKGRDLISVDDLNKEEVIAILERAFKLEKSNSQLLKGKIMASLFFEPSTRTRLSFESAMKRLGGDVIGFYNPEYTSFSKGESLWDTIKMVHSYADLIVIRHFLDGAARLAAEASSVPVINAGDGSNQHPTQTLLDLFTIKQCQGHISNLNIAFVGDLKYGRTVHSLAKMLALFSPRLYFVSPKELKIPKYILDYLESKNIKYSVHEKLSEVLKYIDILYATRIQKERFPDPTEYEKVKNIYIITKSMFSGVKDNLKIMHPLPRVNEIAKHVDDTKYAYYFNQASNAVAVRKAIISMIL